MLTPVRPLLRFFAISYAMSWLFWLPAAAAGLGACTTVATTATNTATYNIPFSFIATRLRYSGTP